MLNETIDITPDRDGWKVNRLAMLEGAARHRADIEQIDMMLDALASQGPKAHDRRYCNAALIAACGTGRQQELLEEALESRALRAEEDAKALEDAAEEIERYLLATGGL